jgi:hypothetical protein
MSNRMQELCIPSQAWYAEFLHVLTCLIYYVEFVLEINLQFVPQNIRARLKLMTDLASMHTHPVINQSCFVFSGSEMRWAKRRSFQRIFWACYSPIWIPSMNFTAAFSETSNREWQLGKRTLTSMSCLFLFAPSCILLTYYLCDLIYQFSLKGEGGGETFINYLTLFAYFWTTSLPCVTLGNNNYSPPWNM